MKQSMLIKAVSTYVAVRHLFYLDCFVPRNDDRGGIGLLPVVTAKKFRNYVF
jgi:hypothetical protein